MTSENEKLSKWEPVEGLDKPFIEATIHFVFPVLRIRMAEGRTRATEYDDLIVIFDDVQAFTVHEEFVHPTQGTVFGNDPVISNGPPYTFPCLTVTGSAWFESLQLMDRDARKFIHYRLCTAFPVVDVVTATPPVVKWHRCHVYDKDPFPDDMGLGNED